MSKNKTPPVDYFEEQYTVKEILRLSNITERYADWMIDELDDPLEEGPAWDRIKGAAGAVRDAVVGKPKKLRVGIGDAPTKAGARQAGAPTGIERVKGQGEIKPVQSFTARKQAAQAAAAQAAAAGPKPYAQTRAGQAQHKGRALAKLAADRQSSLAKAASVRDDVESPPMSTLMDDMRRIAGLNEISPRFTAPKPAKDRSTAQTSGVAAPAGNASITGTLAKKVLKPDPVGPGTNRPGQVSRGRTLSQAHGAPGNAPVPIRRPAGGGSVGLNSPKVEDARVEDYNVEEQRRYAGITRGQTWEEAFDEAGALEERRAGKNELAKARRDVVGGDKHANFEIKRTNRQDRRGARNVLKHAVKSGSDDTVEKIPNKSKKANPRNVS